MVSCLICGVLEYSRFYLLFTYILCRTFFWNVSSLIWFHEQTLYRVKHRNTYRVKHNTCWGYGAKFVILLRYLQNFNKADYLEKLCCCSYDLVCWKDLNFWKKTLFWYFSLLARKCRQFWMTLYIKTTTHTCILTVFGAVILRFIYTLCIGFVNTFCKTKEK